MAECADEPGVSPAQSRAPAITADKLGGGHGALSGVIHIYQTDITHGLTHRAQSVPLTNNVITALRDKLSPSGAAVASQVLTYTSTTYTYTHTNITNRVSPVTTPERFQLPSDRQRSDIFGDISRPARPAHTTRGRAERDLATAGDVSALE